MTTIARRLRLTESYGGLSLFGFFALVFGGLAVFAITFTLALVLGQRAYGHGVCNRWSEQTGIETKFVVLGFVDTGSCLARTPDGRWILNSQWVTFVKGDK